MACNCDYLARRESKAIGYRNDGGYGDWEAPSGAWVEAPDELGEHDRVAVLAALHGLERDGFVELRDGRARLAQDG